MVVFWPQEVRADSNYTGCDVSITTDDYSWGSASGVWCGNTTNFSENMTVYAVALNFHTVDAGTLPMYVKIDGSNSGSSGCMAVGNAPTETGVHVFVLPTPYEITAGQWPLASFRTDSGCSSASGMSSYRIFGDDQNSVVGMWQYWYFEEPVIEPPDTRTRIISVVPHATTTATTTAVGFTGYVDESDFVEGMYVEASFFNPTIGATSANVIDACNVFGAGLCKLEFPISTFGDIASSTEITFNYGGTTKVTWTIRVPTFWSSLWVVGGLFQDIVLDTWKDSFVVGYQTLFDQSLNGDGTQVNGDSSGLVGYFTTGGTSSTTPVAAGCATIFTGGTIVSCLTGLIIPDSQTLAYDFKLLYDGAFSKVPFGYITRFLTIVSGNAGAVEPPALSYTFGSSSPSVLQGKNYTVQIWDNMDVLTMAVADDGSDKNIWDIVMPYFNVVVALVVLLAILTDLMGFEFGRTPKELEEDMYGSLTPSEKALANRAQIQARHGGGTVKR